MSLAFMRMTPDNSLTMPQGFLKLLGQGSICFAKHFILNFQGLDIFLKVQGLLCQTSNDPVQQLPCPE